jgi:hypothetical protein
VKKSVGGKKYKNDSEVETVDMFTLSDFLPEN